MPDTPNFEDKFTNPQPITPPTLGDTLAALQKSIEQMPQKLTSSLDKALAAQRALNAEAEHELALKKELNKLLRSSETQYIKQAKQMQIEKKDAQELWNIRQKEGLQAAQKTQQYQKQLNLLKQAHAEDRAPSQQGDMAMRGMMGYQVGGLKGAALGASGWGSFITRFIGSMGPGGESPADVLHDTGIAKKYMSGRMGQMALKGLGGFGGAMGWIGAGLMVRNQLDSMIGDRTRALELAGQQVGGGIGAGLHMQRRALQLSLNPFDAITSQIAQEIVQQTTAAGFKGRQADQIENAAKSVYIKTGMSVQDIIRLTALGIRDMGMSLKETEHELKTFHDNVKDSNMSLQEYTQRVESTATLLASQGQGPSSFQTSQALNKMLGPPFQQGQLNQILQNPLFQAQLGAQTGVPAAMAVGMASPQQIERALGSQVQQQRKYIEGTARGVLAQQGISNPSAAQLRHAEAAAINAYGLPQFRGLGVPQIEQLLKLSNRNQFAARATQQDRALSYSEGYRQTFRGPRHTLTDKEIEKARQDIGMHHELRNMTPEELALKRKYGEAAMDDAKHRHGLPGGGHIYATDEQEARFRRLRERSFKNLKGSNITPKEMEEFSKHLYDPKFDWGTHLKNARLNKGRVKGQTVDVHTDQGTVVIKLDPKTKSWYLERDDKAKANNAGDGRRNDLRPYMPTRTAAENRSAYQG